eukprot:scpid76073/ scgid14207/ 
MALLLRVGARASPLRHAVAFCSNVPSAGQSNVPVNESGAISLDDPSLTPHQRMALALRRKREKSKRVQKLPTRLGSIHDCVRVLRSAPDMVSVRNTLEQLENNTDFAMLHTADIQHLMSTLHELRVDTATLSQMVCSTLIARLRNDMEVHSVISTFLLMVRYERLPLSVLQALDELVCDNNRTLPVVILGSAAQVFSRAKDYPRHRQVMEHLGVRINEYEHIHHGSLPGVLSAYHGELIHLLPRSYALKVQKFLEVEFDRLLARHPGVVVLSLRLMKQFDIKMSAEFLLSTFQSIRLSLEQDPMTKDHMMRVLTLLDHGDAVDQHLQQLILNSIGSIEDKPPMFIQSLIQFLTTYSIMLPEERQIALNSYLRDNIAFFMETYFRRKTLLTYLSKAPSNPHLSSQLIEEMCEKSISDMHTLLFSDAIQLVDLLAQLPSTDFRPLIRFYTHLAVRLHEEGAFKKLTIRDIESLGRSMTRTRLFIPRMLSGLCMFVEHMGTDRFTGSPLSSCKWILLTFGQCGFLEDPQALAAVSRMEQYVKGSALKICSVEDQLRLALCFCFFQRFPRALYDSLFRILSVPSFSMLGFSAEDKYRLIAFLSSLKATDVDLPVPQFPDALISELQTVMITRMCSLLRTARSKNLRKMVYSVVGNEDAMLSNIVSPSGYVIDVAVLIDAHGALARWSDYDFVSDLDTTTQSTYMDLEQKRIFPVVVDVQRATSLGLQPIAITAISPTMSVLNTSRQLVGTMALSCWMARLDGWKVITLFELDSSATNKVRIAEELNFLAS